MQYKPFARPNLSTMVTQYYRPHGDNNDAGVWNQWMNERMLRLDFILYFYDADIQMKLKLFTKILSNK